eukprot:4925229-Amphidinium_carterae.1
MEIVCLIEAELALRCLVEARACASEHHSSPFCSWRRECAQLALVTVTWASANVSSSRQVQKCPFAESTSTIIEYEPMGYL